MIFSKNRRAGLASSHVVEGRRHEREPVRRVARAVGLCEVEGGRLRVQALELRVLEAALAREARQRDVEQELLLRARLLLLELAEVRRELRRELVREPARVDDARAAEEPPVLLRARVRALREAPGETEEERGGRLLESTRPERGGGARAHQGSCGSKVSI